MTMFRSVALTSLCLMTAIGPVLGQKDEEKRLAQCTEVMGEILNIPEGIPHDLLNKAECVAVMPSVKKIAIGLGGSYGKGALICRTKDDFTGPWGTPAMYRLEGGSIGFQLGGTATDFVLLVMNPKGASSLISSKVKLGADASAAAGPKGRTTSAATDAAMTAEILSYSRSKGLFAGVSLEGSTLREDSGANEKLFAQKVSAREIVLEGKVSTPPSAKPLAELLQAESPKNLSN